MSIEQELLEMLRTLPPARQQAGLERVRGLAQERQDALQWAELSARSFARDWESAADAAYDRLS